MEADLAQSGREVSLPVSDAPALRLNDASGRGKRNVGSPADGAYGLELYSQNLQPVGVY